MLASWTKVLPYFIVFWLVKRYAERTNIQGMPGFVCALPYRNTLISWRRQPTLCEDEGCEHHGNPHVCNSVPTTTEEPRT